MHPWKIPSPFQPPPPPSGFSAVITMFGSGATYNADGTVTGTPNGAIYTYNPAAPDAHTTAINRGNFVSPFAGFTQSSIECIRDDTPVLRGSLRVIFRQDVSPNPNRIEIIVECGTPTTNGSAANLGPFSLQILNNGVPQNIPAYTVSGAGNTWVPGGATFTGTTNVTTAYFPSMGWFSRWRWNPTPRAQVRTVDQLLPSALNLVPNFSPSLATQFNCLNTGAASGPNPINQYSSAWTNTAGTYAQAPTNYNPIGVNENCTIATALGGVGDRPELGVATEWQANYIINGNAAAQAAMYTLCAVGGGMPWIARELSSGAPLNFITTYRNYSFGAGGDTQIDIPTVPVPSQGVSWDLGDVNHIPPLFAIPYYLTGDTFFLENLQFAANWLLGRNTFHREGGWSANYPDPSAPTTPTGWPSATLPLFPSYRQQTRGLGWGIRDFSNYLMATPSSPPGWLLPQSYAQTCLNDNQVFAVNNSAATGGTVNTVSTYVSGTPPLPTFGFAPGGFDFEAGFFVAYALLGLGLAINQAGQSNWTNYLNYFSTLPIGWTNGTSGWPQNWPSPYAVSLLVLSNDYAGNPTQITDFASMWAYFWQTALSVTQHSSAWGNVGAPSYPSNFSAWQPSTAYHCNSWIVETRAGFPIPPNLGDGISVTITGSFSGSPVTVSHTINSSDLNWFAANANFGNQSVTMPTPVLDDIIAKINASAAGTAGITASYTQSSGVGVGFTTSIVGRIFLSFNSGVVGNITVTGSYNSVGPNAASSLYIQANGDGVHNGVGGSNLFGRPLQYCCAAGGTSASSGGPTGTALQTITATDGTATWMYVPETKSAPIIVPSSVIPAAPQLAQTYAQFSNGSPQPYYAYWMMAGLAVAQTAGVSGASLSHSNVMATMVDYITNRDPTFRGRFSFSIAP